MFKKIIGVFMAIGALALVGCGKVVEVPPTYVGKIKSTHGYKHADTVINPSKFRLDACYDKCDTLVLLSAADNVYSENFDLMMPKDKLKLKFTIDVGLSLKPQQYNQIFDKLPSEYVDDNRSVIKSLKVYEKYAQKRIRTVIQSYMSQYTIEQIIGNREQINAGLITYIDNELAEKIPFRLNYVGIDEINYPDVIVDAQIKSAERQQAIATQNAQNEIELAKIALDENRMAKEHALALKRAENEAEISKIIGDAQTSGYRFHRQMEVLEKMAESQNKTFIPLKMLDNVASDILIAK